MGTYILNVFYLKGMALIQNSGEGKNSEENMTLLENNTEEAFSTKLLDKYIFIFEF